MFILADESEEPTPAGSLPAGAPTDYLRSQFAIRAYSADEAIVDAALITADQGQETVDRLLAREDVAFLHVRFPSYGCFAVRLDRP